MQLVIHSPFGSRINRAWDWRCASFCRKFNFELQAAATEDNIVLSLTTAHSFALEEVSRYLNAATVRPLLIQAMLDADVHHALALDRRRCAGAASDARRAQGAAAAVPHGGRGPDRRRVSRSDRLRRKPARRAEIPDHPLVRQTIDDRLTEAMDLAGLQRLLSGIESGAIQVVARDLNQPSPLALEVLTARPYAYLDDAPLEERRTQAVMARRWLSPEDAADLGRLDADAIARVKAEAWPEA
jgi:ATP-dependent Lhr-like helicase